MGLWVEEGGGARVEGGVANSARLKSVHRFVRPFFLFSRQRVALLFLPPPPFLSIYDLAG